MDRFIIHFGEGVYLRDIDTTKNIVTTQDIQESAILSNEWPFEKEQYVALLEILKKKSAWWEKIYINITLRGEKLPPNEEMK